MRGGFMTDYTDENFEEIAKIIRTDLGLDDEIYLDAIDFLRGLKRHGYIVDYVRVPDHMMTDAEAKYVASERKIYLRESVYVGAEKGTNHHRFTVVHEGAHAIQNHQYERKRSFSNRAKLEKKVPSIRRDESSADRLGAALIAPFHRASFNLETTTQQLMKRFGLSAPAAATRHETLSRIYRRQYNLSRPLPPGIIDFLAAQHRAGLKVTSLPMEDVAALRVRQPPYTGDACPICGAFKMFRVGLHLKCDSETCGAQTGDD
jgi:Zn-dependent peptidase ImmA (M78 family)